MKKSLLLVLLFGLFSMLFSLTGCSSKHYGCAEQTTTLSRHKSTLKPYVVKGKRYQPILVHEGDKQYGISSWYGPNFHGKRTSNGERYNMYCGTAAHKTFPMDTIVRVRNLQNGKSTVVRINDRGPFVDGRIIDCSYAAGKEIGLDSMGIAKVEVEVLGVSAKSTQAKALLSRQVASAPSVKKIQYHREPIGLKLGVYRALNGAVLCSRRYKNRYAEYSPLIKKVTQKDTVLYHVWLVGFKNQNELRAFKQHQRTIVERM